MFYEVFPAFEKLDKNFLNVVNGRRRNRYFLEELTFLQRYF
jgi:hypothetical protein